MGHHAEIVHVHAFDARTNLLPVPSKPLEGFGEMRVVQRPLPAQPKSCQQALDGLMMAGGFAARSPKGATSSSLQPSVHNLRDADDLGLGQSTGSFLGMTEYRVPS